jgi:hypothetical protein
MRLTSTTEFVEAVRRHNEETKHEIILADDPMTRCLGYSCAECENFWEITLSDVRRGGLDGQDWRLFWVNGAWASHPETQSIQLGSPALLDYLNQHTLDRFFGSPRIGDNEGPADLIPLETLEPNAADMEWAHEHINTPGPPRER